MMSWFKCAISRDEYDDLCEILEKTKKLLEGFDRRLEINRDEHRSVLRSHAKEIDEIQDKVKDIEKRIKSLEDKNVL